MGIPKGNGLVEIQGSSEKEQSKFFCMKLVSYLNQEAELGTEEYRRLWDERFSSAIAGSCAYKDKCPIHARTAAKHGHKPIQICFDFK